MPRPRKTAKKGEEPPIVAACHSGACPVHSFSLKPLSADPRDKLAITMQFCPKLTSLSKKGPSVVPILNRDGKEYTPCFILDGDEAHYINYDDKYRQAHTVKKLEYEDSQKTILEPKHGRKSKVCAVCRVEYLDYRDVQIHLIQHIATHSHKERIRCNIYNGYIEELARSLSIQETSPVVDPLDSCDFSESTRNSFELDVFVTKRVKRESQTEEKDIDRSIRWATGLGDMLETHKSCVFQKGRNSRVIEVDEDRVFDHQRSFHVEDYLRFE